VKHIKLIVEYDGSRFFGWQKQPNLKTVQSELEKALSVVCREEIGPLHAAGRTDSGVHARGQVVTFRASHPPDLLKIVNGVSHLMKGELAVISAEYIPDKFHPGHDSTHKQYTYRIMNRPAPAILESRYVWHLHRPLDAPFLHEIAQCLVGTHDFSGFRDSECCAKTPVKTIYSISVVRTGDLIEVTVIGSGFLKQMVRNVVGTLVDIGRGHLARDSMPKILASRNRRLAGVTAPPHGLCMEWVSYDPVPRHFDVGASLVADGEGHKAR
jgi:tRNA pseudouridine38-40 synthase